MSFSLKHLVARDPLLGEQGSRPIVTRFALAGLVIFVLAATTFTAQSNANKSDDTTMRETELAVEAISERLASYNELLYGIRSNFDRREPLSREGYNELIERLEVESRHSGVQVLGAAHLLPARDRDEYETLVNDAVDDSGLGYPSFEIYPETDLTQSLPIDFIEPYVGNEAAFGLDFLSEKSRREAAQTSRDTGLPVATAPITLVQETGSQKAFLVMLAFYEPGRPINTVEQRREAFSGVVYAAFRMVDLMESIFTEGTHEQVTVTDEKTGEVMYGTKTSAQVSGTASDDPHLGAVSATGRTWEVLVNSDVPTLSMIERTVPIATLIGGLFIVGLFVALLRSSRSAHTKAMQLAQEMTGEIRRSTDLLQGVLGAATEVSIIGTDLDGKIELFNAGAERMLGYSADELVGIATPEIFHDPDEVAERAEELGIEPSFEVFVSVSRSGLAETRSWTYERKDGTKVPIILTATPRYDDSGQLAGFIGVATDATEILKRAKRQEDLLTQEREMVARLTEVDTVKNEFVSTTSHELRTPLTSILGYSELLEDELTDAEMSQLVHMVNLIQRNAQRLLLLVEDLLSLSHLESDRFQTNFERCETQQVLLSAVNSIESISSARSISLGVTGHAPDIDGDSTQLERVFLNLLSNAVKFSDDGGRVEVRVTGETELKIEVVDHGIGIPEDEQDQIFTRFFRSRNAEANAIQGTGLGLAIVSKIVEAHSGTVKLESQENVGTKITVTLPLTQDEISRSELPDAELSTNEDVMT